ncbi:Spy/CpxP family protein refolding chaperone [Herminiimonas fonticola]|uniref:Spy/CpxP family protein refolding chaperone n=1 Tax=Herminiimonas fonticola TaxID=303380 RepID=A0A4R6GGK0_9BURK|nr:periplasmic heavy metal sensor [Herminiimonas fonticola]RBA24956.1 Heavy-metal resistance [Herminiimonas fonticola]TDN94071.1 Spy/CpxP family protein refolding chaperone [Herminiimonas fonticola]
MNKQIPSKKSALVKSSSRGRRMIMITAGAALVSALSIVGVSYAQEGQAPQTAQAERHFGPHGKMDPAHAEKRMQHMLKRLVPDATAEQKTKLNAIAKAAFNDLRPIQEKNREARAQGVKLLAQPTIDRNALEQVRLTQQQLADQRSRRVTQAFADAAEVLTPAQRVKAAEEIGKRGHGFGHRGHGPHHDQRPGNGEGRGPAPAAKP